MNGYGPPNFDDDPQRSNEKNLRGNTNELIEPSKVKPGSHNAKQRGTLSIIKPDAVGNNVIGKILPKI